MRPFEPPVTEQIIALRKIVRTTHESVGEAIERLSSSAKVAAGSDWGQTVLCTEDNEVSNMVPAICWGDFFIAIKDGSTNLAVPGDSGTLPDDDAPPREDDTLYSCGIGLATFTGKGLVPDSLRRYGNGF